MQRLQALVHLLRLVGIAVEAHQAELGLGQAGRDLVTFDAVRQQVDAQPLVRGVTAYLLAQ